MTLYNKYLKIFEKSFYLYISFGILLSSCVGGVAAMLVLMNGSGPIEMFELFLITCVAMGYNTAVLANLKPRITYNILLGSVGVNLLIILLNIF
ncbi:hypothetical protein [Galbibacter sp.]|uniref:hypothetical protein n=1 Tax=Galbibacter sp. TaxID=2918471 RepID=UPI002C28C6DA|nr:hypothetical protein [Galbibacter sp.]HLV62680.1 hypothetical protein [Galbibacter sp.]